MKTKKLLSFLLALMMMLSVVPFYASAADPIALSASNIVSYPTVNGSIYYGQIIGEHLTLEGGEVQYNGVKVEGEFQFADPTKRQTSVASALRADIIFVPSNQSEYIGFTESRSRNVTYPALRATPVLVDESNPPAVEGIVEAGVTLSSIAITGGKIKNPYYSEDTNTASATWSWLNPDTVVNESGTYEAVITARNHETLTYQIQVNVENPIAITEVSVLPTIEEFDFSTDLKWSQIEISGGSVVVKDSDKIVDGTFNITDFWKDATPRAGSYEVDVIFTPTDTEKYTSVEMKVTVTVNKAPIKFLDENGNEVVPEITVPYGTKFNDINYYLEPYAYGPDVISISAKDCKDTDVCTTGTYTAILNPINDTNYERTELPFKIIVEPKKIEPTVKKTTEGYYVFADTTDNVQGTFDVYIDGELYKTGVKYLVDKVAYVPEKSGVHTITFVYNPVENDNYVIEKDATITQTINLMHKLTLSDNINNSADRDVYFGDSVEISASLTTENFAGWKVTDANGNEITLDGVDNSSTKITITMPDYDIHVEAIEKNASGGTSGSIFDMDIGDLAEGDSDCALINIIRNIIAKFKTFLQELIETFRSIGDGI